MLKICIVSTRSYYFFSDGKIGRVGGAELDLFLVGKHLSKFKDVSVSFVTANFGQQEKMETFGNIKVFKAMQLKRDLWHFLIAPIMLFRALKKANANFYICAPAGPETGITALFCKIFKKKFIYRTAHEIDCNREYVEKNGFRGKIYEYGLLNAATIFTSVESHKELLRKTYGDKLKKNIIFVPYGLEKGKFNIQNKEYILWVARGEKWKNPQLFLDLAESFPSQKFLMIMPKKNEESEFFETIKKRALTIRNLNFIPGVVFGKIQPYFEKAKVFINTSEYEGFTFTLLQSGFGNTPVLYYKVNPDNIIENKRLGYYANGDMKKMKIYLDKLINEKEIWKEKSQNIGRYILNEHSIEKNVLVWKNALEKL